jgi:hypothetical protein
MSILTERERSRSPLIGVVEPAEFGDLPTPVGHTRAELTALIVLLALPRSRIETVAVGHSRDTASRTAAEAFAAAWKAPRRQDPHGGPRKVRPGRATMKATAARAAAPMRPVCAAAGKSQRGATSWPVSGRGPGSS